MIECRPFAIGDIELFQNYGGQDYLVPLMEREKLVDMVASGSHYTILAEDRILACGGFAPANPYRAVAWALLSEGTPQRFPAVHRMIGRLLNEQPWRRIEAYVDPGFAPAMRWARMLGFELVVPFRPLFYPDGRGAAEWVFYPRAEGA